jgi:hypothetical protein
VTASFVRRIRWHAYRTPLGGLVKSIKSLGAGAELARRRAFLAQLPHDDEIEVAAAELNRFGFVRLDHIANRAVIEQLQAATDASRGRGDKQAMDTFASNKGGLWEHAIDSAMIDGRLDAGSAFTRAAMQPRILSVVAHALGALPRLDYVTVTDSKPMLGEPAYSQLWHLDYDDVRVIKFFIYLTDVETVEDGPFTFLPGPVSDRIGFSIKSHRRDEQMPPHVQLARDVVRVTGPRYSCFMVETTRCQHMGSRVAPGHSRLMYTSTFFVPPRMYPEPKPFFLPTGSESELERAILLAGG